MAMLNNQRAHNIIELLMEFLDGHHQAPFEKNQGAPRSAALDGPPSSGDPARRHRPFESPGRAHGSFIYPLVI